ncbi:MAG: YajG family lipoprotein [Abyssibacter sp.]|uniref:YajG family lipoprotein n=1 Tax=Abyssibacter sp. TaxID=2320200 RepID=UPI00321AE255
MKHVLLVLLPALSLLSGCVTGTRTLEGLDVPTPAAAAKTAGTVYIAAVDDNRQFEQAPRSPSTPSVKGQLSQTNADELATRIGRQRNGYGKAMGDVRLPAGVTVNDKMRELLIAGLKSRGYEVVDHPAADNTMTVDINEFWAWFSPGFFAVTYEAQLACEAVFNRPEGPLPLTFAGYGKNVGQVASNANWELAYERAFDAFLENMEQTLHEHGL